MHWNAVKTISLAHKDIIHKFAQPFEPAVLFSMSFSSLLWQYRLSSFTKTCVQRFHQLLSVVTESHLMKTCFDDTALILATFLLTGLLCGAL